MGGEMVDLLGVTMVGHWVDWLVEMTAQMTAD